jgi:hypothetical protein
VTPRRIVQVSSVSETKDHDMAILALCDDGSLWLLPRRPDLKWERLPPIPDDGPL